MKFKWELISDESYCETKRAKVFGGWIVMHREIFDSFNGEATSMVFLPDGDYKWRISK